MQESNGKPIAFLDTNVLASYLRGESPSSHLFSSEIVGRVHFAINPIVLQELLSLLEDREHPEMLKQIQQEVRILPLNLEKADEYLKKAVNLRDRITHSNDVLILSSAADCDYLVTYDKALKNVLDSPPDGRPHVVTPEQLIARVESRV